MAIELQIELADIVTTMQEMFPREYTICIQKLQITRLEAMIEGNAGDGVGLSHGAE